MNEVCAEIGRLELTYPIDINAFHHTKQPFDKDEIPARTCVGVATLPLGAAFEMECMAGGL
jgi:enamine deaminase RidA (YjgF/YER057c/UK114 family)